ncbi:MAG: AAA family ATPase [Patescibacteria group bacterium]
MIIGFLGKGGSGKSTLATAMTEYISHIGKKVLALDADYNMDLSYNLSVSDDITHLGAEAKKDMRTYLDVDDRELYGEIVLHKTEKQFFSLNPMDTFTKKYTEQIRPNLYAMSIGPQPHEVLHGKMCSHGLGAVLKVYLPLLQLGEHEHVIVDEKAGADGVSTGIPTGFDFAVVVVEPTPHGIKTAKQIGELLEYFKTPYGFVVNKVKESTDIEKVKTELNGTVITCIPFGEYIDSACIKDIYEYVKNYRVIRGDMRLQRSIDKFTRNKSV